MRTNKMLDLEAIKARLDKATPGPWNLRDWIEGDGGLRGIYVDSESGKWIHATECPANQDQHDADLIANCPTDLRACIAEIERLRDRVSELEARLICDLCGLCKTHHRLLPHQPIVSLSKCESCKTDERIKRRECTS